MKMRESNICGGFINCSECCDFLFIVVINDKGKEYINFV